MSQSGSKFLKSESGSLIPIFAIAVIPMIVAVGLSMDYTSAVSSRASMQNALDAAALSITTLPTTTSDADRQVKLQEAFAANGGQGTVKLDSFVVDTFGTATANVSGSYAMRTNFMQIARVDTVEIGVKSAVRKTPSLVQATFKVDRVSGYWNKTVTLYGTKFGATTAQKLMTASYVYSPYTYSYTAGRTSYSMKESKGYGTTTLSTVNGSTSTVVQTQTCTTAGSTSAFTNPPATAIVTSQYDSSSRQTIYFKTTCTTATVPANGAGAAVDVSQMNGLYLQMDVTTGTKATFQSNDSKTSNHLYLGTAPTPLTEVASGKTVDIFTVVPCSQTSYQAWEDGGNALPAAYTNADFIYNVTGKCDFNQRPSETMLTQ
jgi:Flp pilus assembly protein TadG